MARASESAEGIQEQSRASHAASQSARVYARLGNVDEAFAASKRVDDPQLKLYALTATVRAAVDAGESTRAIVAEAKQTLDGNENAFTNAAMQKLLAVSGGKQEPPAAGPAKPSMEDSLETLRLQFSVAVNRDEKLAAYEPLASGLLKSRLFAELEAVIEAMVDRIEKNPQPKQSSKFGVYGDPAAIARVRGMHLQMALALADSNQFDEALRQFERVDLLIDALPDASALVKWQLQDLRIHVLLKLGRIDDAVNQLAKIQTPFILSCSASAIAAHQIKAGDVVTGLKMAERIGNEQGSGAARGTVAIALLGHANSAEATMYLNQLGESDDDTASFIAVARHWVERGESDRLLSTFQSLKSPVARTHYAIAAAEFLVLSVRVERP